MTDRLTDGPTTDQQTDQPTNRRTNGQTNQPTDQWTNRRMDMTSNRDARAASKKQSPKKIPYCATTPTFVKKRNSQCQTKSIQIEEICTKCCSKIAD